MFIGIVSAGCWFCLFILFHCGIFHFCSVRRRSGIILLLFLAGLLGHMLTCFFVFQYSRIVDRVDGNLIISLVAGLLVLACLFVLYMPFYYVLANSLSVQSLIYTSRSSEGMLSIQELRKKVASSSIVQRRLEAMAANGYLKRNGTGYRLTRNGRIVSAFFAAMKTLWKLGAGG